MLTMPPLYAHIALNVKVVFLTCVYKSVNRCRKMKLVTQNESVLKSEPTSFLNSVITAFKRNREKIYLLCIIIYEYKITCVYIHAR